jgi:hypothetical protein
MVRNSGEDRNSSFGSSDPIDGRLSGSDPVHGRFGPSQTSSIKRRFGLMSRGALS